MTISTTQIWLRCCAILCEGHLRNILCVIGPQWLSSDPPGMLRSSTMMMMINQVYSCIQAEPDLTSIPPGNPVGLLLGIMVGL
jgi:hypothetical protein